MKNQAVICAFFGHRCFGYEMVRENIKSIIVDLIKNQGITEFYNGFRGDFDCICAEIVRDLKSTYPTIKNILVLSYYPKADFVLPTFFDESVYLLEEPVPMKFAIFHTNRKIVDAATVIVSGVKLDSGGAWAACEYARFKNKNIISIF